MPTPVSLPARRSRQLTLKDPHVACLCKCGHCHGLPQQPRIRAC